MSNIAVWNVRLRHESLSTEHKGKYMSRRKRSRIGIQDALDRKAGITPGQSQSDDAEA